MGTGRGPGPGLLFMMLFSQVPSPFTESCSKRLVVAFEVGGTAMLVCKVEVKAPGAVGTLPTARKDLAWASVWQEDVSDVVEVSP